MVNSQSKLSNNQSPQKSLTSSSGIKKWMLIVLAILILLLIGVYVWSSYQRKAVLEQTIKSATKYTVQGLTDDKEISLGTIIYPGATAINEIDPKAQNTSGSYKATDSFDGVVNVYIGDLANRYPNNKLSINEIDSDTSLTGKAKVITSKGDTGTIVITAWPGKDGFTYFEISRK